MKIIIDRSNEERQSAITTIDTKTCHYPYSIREAIELALKLDGHPEEAIDEIFNRQKVVCVKKDNNPSEPKTKNSEFTFAYMGHIIRFSIVSELEAEDLVYEILRQLTKGESDKFIKLP